MVKCSACCQQVAMLQGLCVCVNRNMKIANSSHIKRFFHYFFVCCCCCFFFCEGVAEEIFNSPQTVQGYFIIHRKASQRGRIFVI